MTKKKKRKRGQHRDCREKRDITERLEKPEEVSLFFFFSSYRSSVTNQGPESSTTCTPKDQRIGRPEEVGRGLLFLTCCRLVLVNHHHVYTHKHTHEAKNPIDGKPTVIDNPKEDCRPTFQASTMTAATDRLQNVLTPGGWATED